MDATSQQVEEDNSVELESTSSGSAGGSCELSNQDSDNGQISILCEIVGARDLILRDNDERHEVDEDLLRPFCILKYGDRIIHTTKSAEDKGPNPIWTASRKSLFLIRATPNKFSEAILSIGIYSKHGQGLAFRLNGDSNRTFLGQVNFSPDEILAHCDGQRFEAMIEDEVGEETSLLGKLALRFQVATANDEQVVQLFNEKETATQKSSSSWQLSKMMSESNSTSPFQKVHLRPQAKLCTEIDESEVAQTSFVNAISSVFAANSISDAETGGTKVRVKPYPDSLNEEATKFLSSEEIRTETKQASHRWIEAGSGSLGKLYCEVLSCHDLPNVDVGEFMGNVTDSFVCLVYEDTCAMTDVIDDELSPHWLPWTQRAFCFGMMHPASILYVGVFDYDLGTAHEPLGRVAVNVSNLQRNTVHTLKYNLYPSSNVTERAAVGSITIRLRIECPDEKVALLAALKPRPKIFVNVKKAKSLTVLRYTCFGEYDGEEKFDMTVMRSYINEMFEHKAAFGYAIKDGLTSLIFWRGQVQVFSLMLPVHSFLFFCMASDLVERPYMIVPYSLLSVAWIMIATLTVRRQHPSPWHNCPSLWHYVYVLWTGKAPTPVESIKQYENYEAAQIYEKQWRDRIEQDQLNAAKRLELQKELNEVGDDDIATKSSPNGISMDIISRLTRYQGMLGRYCGHMRFMKIILTWEESVVSFWLTAGFLVTGFVTMLLPWRFILTWIGRAFVWGLLGPQMKLVDIYLQANKKKDRVLNEFVQKFDIARLRREEALKTKDIKAVAFGKYSSPVPSFNIARHFDRPLPESSARICRTKPKSGTKSRRRVSVVNLKESPWIPGQHLYGDMIPRPEHEIPFYENELKEKKIQLQLFKRSVEEYFASNGAAATEERKKLTKLGIDAEVPLSLGYEVVPEFDIQSTSLHEGSSHIRKNKKISVILTSSEVSTNNFDDGNEVTLESDGFSIHEIKKPRQDVKEVAGEEQCENSKRDCAVETCDCVSEERERLLELIYSNSDATEVTLHDLNSTERDSILTTKEDTSITQ